MKDAIFVHAKDMKTLEQYGASLISSLISLKTLESFHLQAFSKGLLDEDELETGKTICWELQRLILLYKTQIQNVLDRTALNSDQVMEDLKGMIPGIKIPKKRKDVQARTVKPEGKTDDS